MPILTNYPENINELLFRVKHTSGRAAEEKVHLFRWVRRKRPQLMHRSIGKIVYGLKSKAPIKGVYGSSPQFPEKNYLQNSIVKVSYSSNEKHGHWAAHGKYLQRAGANREGEIGFGFSYEDNEVDVSKTLDSWQKTDKRIFRLIVSPEQGYKLDLKEHAKQMMFSVEKDIGTKLEWIGIEHHNTDNPHVHILIRGRDANGNQLRFDKNYIQKGFRLRSKETATREIGFQLKDDILKRRKRAIEQERVTELDREILKNINSQNQITFEKPVGLTDYQGQRRNHIIGRLQFLETIGFVKRSGAMTWNVDENLLHGLKVYQLSQDIIKRKSQHIGSISDPDLPFVHTRLKPGERVIGRVAGVGLHDELRDKLYFLMEGLDGKVHYIHPTRKMIKSRSAGEIKNGDILELEIKTFIDKKSKKEISYLDVKNWGNLTILTKQGSVEADRFVLSQLSKNPDSFVEKSKSNTFRAQFNDWARRRAHALRTPIDIQSKDLKKLSRLVPIYKQAVTKGWLKHSHSNFINFSAAAIRANRISKTDPVPIFIDTVKNKRWRDIRPEHEDRAIQLIKKYRQSSSLRSNDKTKQVHQMVDQLSNSLNRGWPKK